LGDLLIERAATVELRSTADKDGGAGGRGRTDHGALWRRHDDVVPGLRRVINAAGVVVWISGNGDRGRGQHGPSRADGEAGAKSQAGVVPAPAAVGVAVEGILPIVLQVVRFIEAVLLQCVRLVGAVLLNRVRLIGAVLLKLLMSHVGFR
jgi:hypothetical protein